MSKKIVALMSALIMLTACSAKKPQEQSVIETVADTGTVSTVMQTQEQTEYGIASGTTTAEQTQQKTTSETKATTTAKQTQAKTTAKVQASSTTKPPQKETQTQTSVKSETVRAVWVTCYEFSGLLSGGESSFRQKAQQLVDNCVKNNINTLFLQVRPYFDAFYPSEIFSWSTYAMDKQGNPPSFDPLKIFVNCAHSKGVDLHAWINPYRISYDKDYKVDKKYADFTVSCDAGVYLLPSSTESQKLVLSGVREILNNYDVDGIHIDDYFYPTASKEFDAKHYKAYTDNGGKLSLNAWRQSNVNSLVSSMYSLVHSLKSDAIFSISPAADIEKDKTVHCANVELWCREKGYADWIIPQMYYGFENEKMPFLSVASQWENLASKGQVKLICGLAVYKDGKVDEYAGTGKNEWKENADIIERQMKYVASSDKWCGYSMFSYSSL